MISIIISSEKEHRLRQVTENIGQTIGVAHEVIPICNSGGKFGICEAYNRGAREAAFDILCFMHEDVSFETPGWGLRVLAHLEDERVGLIGLAGGDTKGLVPSSWSSSIFPSEIHIIQHYKDPSRPPEKIAKTGYPLDPSPIQQVACIDGVWMCTRRDVFARYQFDSRTFKGFHGYDIDYSLQVFDQFKVCVISDILVHHYSEGSYSKTWMENMLLLSRKWRKSLPRSVRALSRQELLRQHWTAMNIFIGYLKNLGFGYPSILKYFFIYSFNRFFHFRRFLYSLRLLLGMRTTS